MMNCLPQTMSFNSHKASLCDYKTYILYKNGLYKTARRNDAIELLKAGWYDKTKYEPKEEVLNYGTEYEINERRFDARQSGETNSNHSGSERQHEESSCRSESSSEREESRHKQHQSNVCDDGREEYAVTSIRSGASCGEVSKKRGRPKRVK